MLAPVLLHWHALLSLQWLGIVKLVDSVAVVLARLGTHDGLSRAQHDVLKLERLDEIRVPDHAAVERLEVVQALVDVERLVTALLQQRLVAEDGSVLLHGLLELSSKISHLLRTISVAYLVK